MDSRSEAPTDHTCYLASFDSVRFSGKDISVGSIGQGQFDVISSILHGRSLVVSESMAMDSAGFLDVAPVLLNSRSGQLEAGLLHPCLREPIKFTAFGTSEKSALRAGFAKRFANTDRQGQGVKRFRLSAWAAIDTNPGARERIADCIQSGDWDTGARILEVEVEPRISDRYLRQWDALRRIVEHVESGHGVRLRKALPASRSLLHYFEAVEQLTDRDIREFESERVEECAINLRSVIRRLKESGISLSDRSMLRNAREVDDILGSEDRRMVVAAQDMAYNLVVAESTGATFREIRSGVGIVRDDRSEVAQLLMAYAGSGSRIFGGIARPYDSSFHFDMSGLDVDRIKEKIFREWLFPVLFPIDDFITKLVTEPGRDWNNFMMGGDGSPKGDHEWHARRSELIGSLCGSIDYSGRSLAVTGAAGGVAIGLATDLFVGMAVPGVVAGPVIGGLIEAAVKASIRKGLAGARSAVAEGLLLEVLR